MPYKMDLIRRSRQESSNWSGGTTTQIAIYPRTPCIASATLPGDLAQPALIWSNRFSLACRDFGD